MARIEGLFGAHDSELKGGEYIIPDGMDAEIKDGKIIVKEKESEDEKIRKWLIELIENWNYPQELFTTKRNIIAWLEKQKEQKERLHCVISVLSDGCIKKSIEIYPDECDCKAGDVVKAIIKKY